jgi:hypothetical protein
MRIGKLGSVEELSFFTARALSGKRFVLGGNSVAAGATSKTGAP